MEHQENSHNKGMWTLSKWSRRPEGTQMGLQSSLRYDERKTDTPEVSNEGKAEVLSTKFFPESGQADTADILAGFNPHDSKWK